MPSLRRVLHFLSCHPQGNIRRSCPPRGCCEAGCSATTSFEVEAAFFNLGCRCWQLDSSLLWLCAVRLPPSRNRRICLLLHSFLRCSSRLPCCLLKLHPWSALHIWMLPSLTLPEVAFVAPVCRVPRAGDLGNSIITIWIWTYFEKGLPDLAIWFSRGCVRLQRRGGPAVCDQPHVRTDANAPSQILRRGGRLDDFPSPGRHGLHQLALDVLLVALRMDARHVPNQACRGGLDSCSGKVHCVFS